MNDLLCFQLYTGSRLMQRMYRPYLEEWGITYAQFLVLRCLWQRDGQTVGELSEPLDLDSGTLSPLLRRMEDAGVITRSHVSSDYRKVYVYLSAKGRALEAPADAMVREVYEELGLTTEDVQALRGIVAKIRPPVVGP